MKAIIKISMKIAIPKVEGLSDDEIIEEAANYVAESKPSEFDYKIVKKTNSG